MTVVRPYPDTPRRLAYEQFARNWNCPRCGGPAQVFNLCHYCRYETWGRWINSFSGPTEVRA